MSAVGTAAAQSRGSRPLAGAALNQDVLFILEEDRLTNSRREAEAYLGEEIDDYVWETLAGNSDVRDLELGLTDVPQLAAKARRLAAVLYGPAERPETDEPDKVDPFTGLSIVANPDDAV